MNVAIFGIYHAPTELFAKSEVFVPLMVGAVEHHSFLSDWMLPDNISDRQSFAELRGHYFVWKNCLNNLDFVGFHHYRRALLFEDILFGSKAFMYPVETGMPFFDVTNEQLRTYFDLLQTLSKGEITDYAKQFDIIVPNPYKVESLKYQYDQVHRIEDWNVLVEILAKRGWEIPDKIPLYGLHMFLMPKALFRDFMAEWWEVMSELWAKLDIPTSGYQRRAIAFLSERFFSFWLNRQKGMKIKELPWVEGPKIAGEASDSPLPDALVA